MYVTKILCKNCGYEWVPRGKPRRCPSCLAVLGETRVLKWKCAGRRLGEFLTFRGWRLRSADGLGAIDVCAEKNGEKLFIDVKSGRTYHIRRSQIENLLKYRDEKSDVGFAFEVDGKFYLFTLKDILQSR